MSLLHLKVITIYMTLFSVKFIWFFWWCKSIWFVTRGSYWKKKKKFQYIFGFSEQKKRLINLEYKTINYHIVTLFTFSKHSYLFLLSPHHCFSPFSFLAGKQTFPFTGKPLSLFFFYIPRHRRKPVTVFRLKHSHSLSIPRVCSYTALDLSVTPYHPRIRRRSRMWRASLY